MPTHPEGGVDVSSQTHPASLRLEPINPAREMTWDDQRLPGFILFVLAAQFMTVIMLAASMAPAYDFNAGAISDLGVVPETAFLFNASLIAVGVLNVVGGFLFFRTHRKPWILTTYLLAGIGALGAGSIPLDTSDFHSLFALAAFLFFNLEALATATVLRGPMRAVSVLAGAIGIAFVVVMIIGDSGNPAIFGVIGHGGAERLIVYPVMLWMLALGGYLMATPDALDR
jgi:hypothetical membrane protein